MTEGTFNSLTQPDCPYQITCAEEHDIQIQGLRNAIAVMKARKNVTLYL